MKNNGKMEYKGSLLYQRMKRQRELNKISAPSSPMDILFPNYSIVANSYIWVPSIAILPLIKLDLMPQWYFGLYNLTLMGVVPWMFFGKPPKDEDTAVFYLKLLTLVFVVILILYLIYKLGMSVLHMQGLLE